MQSLNYWVGNRVNDVVNTVGNAVNTVKRKKDKGIINSIAYSIANACRLL
ncbi:hypothetical protein RU86_GL000620 [Lactococcus piscium]|uniref:Uncharacterized protein n=1 Tax=Pseudolactococcus piscium TaxID=1364 RepID=A0A2A5RWL0_9LACT|nr:hypothetical protein RU86_GL000620 [Lactococcus piscium]